MQQILIRKIKQADNATLAKIIRETLTEFKANKPGTVYYDVTTDDLYQVFKKDKSIYFVAECDDEIVGGGGIYPTESLAADTCELVKLYLSPNGRSKGIGKRLLQKCMEAAKENGYKKMYLETMPELTIAIPLYIKLGFTFLTRSQGCSGHTGCDIWMIKNLD
ncbi:MAG TPA: GNAT family N-acetyltransferase [Ferruginibacter sp.]|nr:GNAT family N-acetyltransferase [Ferruginibacter sp.]